MAFFLFPPIIPDSRHRFDELPAPQPAGGGDVPALWLIVSAVFLFLYCGGQEVAPWAFHFNAGYGRNESTADEERDIWHVSLASEFEAAKWVKLVANVGAERNTDKESDTPAVFVLGGLIFPVTENLDLDVGAKAGLTRPEADYAILAGLAFRF